LVFTSISNKEKKKIFKSFWYINTYKPGSPDKSMKRGYCRCCDYGPNGLMDCSSVKEKGYIPKGGCSWAGMGGTRVRLEEGSVMISETEEVIPMGDPDRIIAAIEERKAEDNAPFRTPKQCPYERIFSKG
jgi:hypothetical protein